MQKTISRDTAKERIIDNTYLQLLIDDYQYGMAMDDEHNGFFELPDEKKAEMISKFIEEIIHIQLKERVLEYLKKEK